MGYPLVQGMQEVAPLHCDWVAGEELSTLGCTGLERRGGGDLNMIRKEENKFDQEV